MRRYPGALVCTLPAQLGPCEVDVTPLRGLVLCRFIYEEDDVSVLRIQAPSIIRTNKTGRNWFIALRPLCSGVEQSQFAHSIRRSV